MPTTLSGVIISFAYTPRTPIVGNAEVWADRIALGIDVLYDHAINGFDGDAPTPMLPKGGRVDLSDQEVRDAVDYMVAESS